MYRSIVLSFICTIVACASSSSSLLPPDVTEVVKKNVDTALEEASDEKEGRNLSEAGEFYFLSTDAHKQGWRLRGLTVQEEKTSAKLLRNKCAKVFMMLLYEEYQWEVAYCGDRLETWYQFWEE